MRIRSLHIDGFGLFCDTSVDELPAGMAVFVGSNESGKSTLMEFVRYVLFGSPAGEHENGYPPLCGEPRAGRLDTVLDDDRPLTIDRNDRRVTLRESDLEMEQIEPSPRLLGGIDRGVFERVFAVALEDMQGTRFMNEPDVAGRLFATESGLSGQSLPAAVERIGREVEGLLIHGGEAQQIPRLKSQLHQVAEQIDAHVRQAEEYAASRQRYSDLAATIRQRRDRAEQIRSRLDRIAQLDEAREHWMLRDQHRKRASKLAHARDFPPGGLQRFESLHRELDDLERHIEDQREKLDDTRAQRDKIHVDDAILGVRGEIEQLSRQRNTFAIALDELPRVTDECGRRQTALGNRLRDLGPEWDAARLVEVDTSMQTRQQVVQLGQELQQAQVALATADAQLELHETADEEARKSVSAAMKQAEPLPIPAEKERRVVEARLDAAQRMRSLLHERELLVNRQDERQAACEDLQARLAAVESQTSCSLTVLPIWMFVAIVAVASVLSVAAAWTESYVSAAAYPIAAALLVVALAFMRRRQIAAEATRLDRLSADKQRLSDRCKAVELDLHEFRDQIADVMSQLKKTASAVELEIPGGMPEAERLAGDLAAELEHLIAWSAAQDAIQSAHEQEKAAAGARQMAAERQAAAGEQVEQLTRSWQQWLEERGFSAATAVDQFGLVLEAIERGRQAARDLADSQHKREDLEQRIARFHRRVAEVRQRCGLVGTETEIEPGLAGFDELSTRCSRAMENEQEHRRLTGLEREFSAELVRLERHQAKKKGVSEKLMRVAGAEDDEAFLQAADARRNWQQSSLAADEEELALQTIVGSQASRRELVRELRKTPPGELTAEQRQLSMELAQLDARIPQDEQTLVGIDERLGELASDHSLGERRLEQETLRQSLATAVRRWAVRVVCRTLLDEARHTCENERQPAVVRRASEYLQAMTDNRYRMIRPLGQDGIQLDNCAVGRKEESRWSSGLADQAYLALRLGLAREFARKTESLPVILDDVLVRFDPTRRAATVRVLLDFAAEQQVLLFSCHSDLAALIEEIHGSSGLSHVPLALYDMEDGNVRRRVE